MIANYFRAVETHNPSALPVATNVHITENGHDTKLGEGFFKNGGKVHLERSLIDTERCGTVTEAVTDETIDGAQTLAVMAVRLRVDRGKVSEIETIVTREAEQKCFYNPKALLETKDQDWTTPFPQESGLVLTHLHRRFPVTDLALGITGGFINFNQSLRDVHIFKYNADGKIERIQAVFGGRQQDLIRPDQKR